MLSKTLLRQCAINKIAIPYRQSKSVANKQPLSQCLSWTNLFESNEFNFQVLSTYVNEVGNEARYSVITENK